MAPLNLDGETLGMRHQYYNKLLEDTVKNKADSKLDKINNEEKDIDNIMKIDIACHNKDVDYILEILKCNDMLYISKALKGSRWLITEQDYAYIINPKYLSNQLFPHMLTKAINKFMLNIRLNLRDEKRAEEFYYYVKEENANNAVKWLQICSPKFIETVLSQECKIPLNTFKRLSRKSELALEMYLKNGRCYYSISNYVNAAKTMLNKNYEKYLDIIENLHNYEVPKLGKKYTKIIMKICPDRVFDKFDKYYLALDLATVAKYSKKDSIIDILLKVAKNDPSSDLFSYENIKHFIRYMPKEGRFEFLKKNFIMKEQGKNDLLDDSIILRCAYISCSREPVYKWYRFAPFNVAFQDLKQLIRTESSPSERTGMMNVMLSCVRRNSENMAIVVRYYHDKHINEPVKFKANFVNNLVKQIDLYNINEETWKFLNDIFYSMEVYNEIESDPVCKTQSCIICIMTYNIIHDIKVPEIIEKKFIFHTRVEVQNKLKQADKDKMFNYLFDFLVSKLQAHNVKDKQDFQGSIDLLTKLLKLLKDWNKKLQDYPFVLEKLKETVKINKINSWNLNLAELYNLNKSWKKCMFEESIVMSPCEEVYINALKHDPQLLERYNNEVQLSCCDDSVSLKQLLYKLKLYWPNTLGKKWADDYLQRLDKPGNYTALVRGLCVILPANEFINVVNKYVPEEPKIKWAEIDEATLSIRKHIAKNMYNARPFVPVDIVLLYAKGDYLQYTLPSLLSILHNLSCTESRTHLPKLLNAPVSLQKYGITFSFLKFSSTELKPMFAEIWKTAKNSSIRSLLFTHTFDLLLKEKDTENIEDLWVLMSMFIDNLSFDENKDIYKSLIRVNKVPENIRGRFYMKSYMFLKSIPTSKSSSDYNISYIISDASDIIKSLDSNFVIDNMLSDTYDKFATEDYEFCGVIASFLLSAENEESQFDRYEKVMVPLMNRFLPQWNMKHENKYYVRYNFKTLLTKLYNLELEKYIKSKQVLNIKMYTDIHHKLKEHVPVEDSYIFLTIWQLAVIYVEILIKYNSVLSNLSTDIESDDDGYTGELSEISATINKEFAAAAVEILKADTEKYFPSIYILFGISLKTLLNRITNSYTFYDILNNILEHADLTPCCLLVINLYSKWDEHDGSKFKALKHDVYTKLSKHPSAEVKLHVLHKLGDNFED